MAKRKRVPVSIITGYLGSGKTTLLKKILSDAKDKVAVLMNEFGEIGVDTKAVRGKDVDIKELLGGCACCSLTGELRSAISEILRKVKPDRIVIETTGVAEPDSMTMNLGDISGVKLDSVITVVDCDAFLKFPSLGHTGRMQIESANVIVLNKVDLIEADNIPRIERALREMVPGVMIVRSAYANFGTGVLFDLNAPAISRKHVRHDVSDMESFVYRTDRLLDKSRFISFVVGIPRSVYRAKGHVRFADGTYLFNFVNGRHEISRTTEEATELVFIGKRVSKVEKEVLKKLARCEM